MRLIDADALVRDHGFFIEDEDGFPTCVVCETDIRYYPTIDAVPVVRCGRCEFCKEHPTSDRVKICTNEKWNTEYYPLVDDEWFCYYGKRRSDD